MAGICECGNEPAVSIKYGEFQVAGNRLASQEGLYSM